MIQKEIVNRFINDFRQFSMTPEDKVLTIESWERHLTNFGLKPKYYTKAYELAIKIYNETDFGKGPFNVNHLIQAAIRLQNIEHRNRTLPVMNYFKNEQGQKLLPKESRCKQCNGTLLLFRINHEGKKKIVYEIVNNKQKPVKCPECVK